MVSLRTGAENRITYLRFIFLFMIFPVVKVLVFFANIVGNLNLESWISYSYLLALCSLILFSNTKHALAYSVILVYALIYMYAFDFQPVNSRIAYLVRISFAAYALCFFSKVRFSLLNIKRIDKFIIWFSFFFILTYLLSVYVNPHANRVGGMGTRIYYEGFMISHEFSYYCAILSLYLLFRKPWFYALPVILIGISVGARSGVLLIGLSLFYFIYQKYYRSRRVVARLPFVLLSIGLVVVVVFNLRVEAIHLVEDLYREVLLGERVTTNDFASGRTIILYFFIYEVLNTGFGLGNIVGRGPNSSVLFNDANIGNAIWMHNDFLEVFFTFGALGLTFFLYLIVNLVFKQRSWYLLFFILIAAVTNGFIYYNVAQVLLIVTIMNQNKMLVENDKFKG